MITHKHHIIPRHMGGSDDTSNLIELTIEEHAEAHKRLYEEHGKQQDKIAWLCLSGQITNAEAHRMALVAAVTGNKWSEERKQKHSKKLKGRFAGTKNPMFGRTGEKNPMFGRSHTEETKEKIREKATGRKMNLSGEVREKKASVVIGNKKRYLDKRFSGVDFSDAQELYDGGMSYKDLAFHYGVSTGKIQNLGLKARSYKDAGKVRFATTPISDETRKKMSVAAVLTHKSRKEK